MKNVARCSNFGFECDAVVRADPEAEALQTVAAHAREAHGLDHVSLEVGAEVRSVMRDEPGSASERPPARVATRGATTRPGDRPDRALVIGAGRELGNPRAMTS